MGQAVEPIFYASPKQIAIDQQRAAMASYKPVEVITGEIVEQPSEIVEQDNGLSEFVDQVVLLVKTYDLSVEQFESAIHQVCDNILGSVTSTYIE